MNVDSEINDVRVMDDFKSISFSKFKKNDVKKELLKSLLSGNIEPACNWSAELICSGHFLELWDTILVFVGKHIHLANPKLCIYIEMRYENFKKCINIGYGDDLLYLRNNPKIRTIFAEVICVLCNSNKKHSFQGIKVNKEEFDLMSMSHKLKAPSIQYIQQVYKKEDPKELFIPFNEFAYHISDDSNNILQACYWLEWIMEFQNIMKQKKECCICERREKIPVEDKYQMDPIWIIWDLLFYEANYRNKKVTCKILKSILNLYCLKYSPGSKKRRRYLLYFGISLLTDKYDENIEIMHDKDIIDTVIKKINSVYKQIKKNEITPPTDYLMKDINKNDINNTMKKLDLLNNISIIKKDN